MHALDPGPWALGPGVAVLWWKKKLVTTVLCSAVAAGSLPIESIDVNRSPGGLAAWRRASEVGHGMGDMVITDPLSHDRQRRGDLTWPCWLASS